MIVKIICTFACDNCATPFTVHLDPAVNVPRGWSVMDLAEDAVRGGINGKHQHDGLTSIQNDQHLCIACTMVKDQEDDEDE